MKKTLALALALCMVFSFCAVAAHAEEPYHFEMLVKSFQSSYWQAAVKGVEQSDPAVAGVQEDIANGKVANFPDHYYPSAFDLSALLSEACLNNANGMDKADNVAATLPKLDEKYDAANVQ